MPDPLIRKIPISNETWKKKIEPYVYQTLCCKCGGKLTEVNVWEAIKWTEEGKYLYRLLCEKCAKRAVRHYKKD